MLLLIFTGKAHGAHYKTDRPWETDSVLVAWLIKKHVDHDAHFSSVPRNEKIAKKLSINTPYSPLRRSARFTAFDAASRMYKVKTSCVDKIKPLIRILELTPWRKHEYAEALRFEKGLAPLLPVEPGSGGLEDAFTYIDSFCDSSPINSRPEKPLAFISLINDTWRIITWEKGQFAQIKTKMEPRTYAHDFIHNQTAYIGADKAVRLVSKGEEKILLTSGVDAYTQPFFSPDGKSVFLVKLINGNSLKTAIIRLNIDNKRITPIVTQRSTQLEPFLANPSNLYYSNVSCVEGCGGIIQDIWHKDIISEVAKQVTMLNSISHQPNVGPGNRFLFFSSNARGNYHIWRLNLSNGKYKQLTFGQVTDGFPCSAGNGVVYFIRSLKGSNHLMRLEPDGGAKMVELPNIYRKIRELRIQRKWQ